MAKAASGRVDAPFYRDDHSSDEETLHRIFNNISRILKMEEFDDDLKASLENDHPGYLKILEERAEDLMRKDCAVVITGEISAGKSTIINLLLENDILPEGVMQTTTAICKLRHSDQKKILVYDREGGLIGEEILHEKEENAEERDSPVLDSDFLLEDCLQHSPEREANPDSRSAELTNKNAHERSEGIDNDTYNILERIFKSDQSVGIHSVEVYHPISILKGNIMIVDTPGVGDCDEHNNMLEEYLPYAVAFVFVVDPTRGGGIQEDRIGKVMGSIRRNKDNMKCFNESDVIFAVNKWDAVQSRRKHENPWQDVVDKITKSWPQVNLDNIIKMSAIQVHTGEGEQSLRENFKTFERALRTLIDKNINIRIQEHHRFLAIILSKADKFVKSRYAAVKTTLPELNKTIERCNQRLEALKDKSISANGHCEQFLEDVLKKHGCKLISYVNAIEFQNLVLDSKPDLKGINRTAIGSKISKRIEETIKEWIEQNESSITDEVDNFIKQKFHEIQQDLDDILQRFGCTTQHFEIGNILSKEFSNAQKSWFYGFGIGILSFSALASTYSIPVCATGAAVAVGLSYNYAKGIVETLHMSVNEVIMTSFETRRQAITEKTISKMLDTKYAQRYRKIFNELFTKNIPMEIEKNRRMVNKLATEHDAFQLKIQALHTLSCELDEIWKQLRSCRFLSTDV